jgi:hypothetical protein
VVSYPDAIRVKDNDQLIEELKKISMKGFPFMKEN